MNKKSFLCKVQEAMGVEKEDLDILFVPDAYEIDCETKTIKLYEHVKSNDLSKDKLTKLGMFWMDCDDDGWDVTLTVEHWYGAKSEVNLQDVYYKFCLEPLQRKKSNK